MDQAQKNPVKTVMLVGASLLAKNVNDNAGILNERGACEFFASKLAPTKTVKTGLFCFSQSSIGGQYTTTHLVALDRLEQRLEVALAKPIVAFALDEFEEHWAHQGFREDLQQ